MSQAAPADAVVAADSGPKLKRVLGVPSLVLFGLVYMVPLTVFTTYGIVTQISGGRVAASYLVTLVVMLFTARSYARMSAAFPYAGSAYVYTQRSFGGAVGFLAGWSLMLDYLFLPMINYLVIGIYLEAAFPAVPAWVFILASILIVTVLNVVGIVSVARANVVIIGVQAVFILAFIGFGVASLNGQAVDPLAPFVGDGTADGPGALFAGAAVLCLSFLGFDSVSTMAEEAKDAKRTVPRAIMIVTIAAGVIFVGLSYLSQLVFPSNAFSDVDSAALDVMRTAGGEFLAVFFTAAYVAGAAGSALASQASVSRILYAMGRDGVLPTRFFGRLSARFKTPVIAILCVSVVSLAAIWIDLGLLAGMISFGALVAFSVVNLSVFKHYFVDLGERSGGAVLRNVVLPFVGFGLTVWLWTSLAPETFIVGFIWLAVGVIVLAIATRGFRRPTPMLDLKE
ncbi:amino acid transporter [Agromyces terreus]|uniref:Amino acid transporter n=1 Tax=Agromyces terreus TaxID=424795 RepID=A0A9X2H529_9MICO|nr:APC family permease [Agromyces terreus]MCP2370159.1 amino acid transporter [Agromyces terreus]